MTSNESAFSALAAAYGLDAPGADLKSTASASQSDLPITAQSEDSTAATPALVDELIDFYTGRTSELLALETRNMELLGEFNEQAAEIDAVRVQRNAVHLARQLGEEISGTAGAQTAGYSKAGVTLSGTPALMLKETYEKGAEDLLALEEAASFEQQQILMSGALSRMAAMNTAAAIRSEWVQNLGWNLSSLAAPINYNPDDSLSGGSGASSSNWMSGSLLNW